MVYGGLTNVLGQLTDQSTQGLSKDEPLQKPELNQKLSDKPGIE